MLTNVLLKDPIVASYRYIATYAVKVIEEPQHRRKN